MSKGAWFWLIFVLAALAYFGALIWGGPTYGPIGTGIVLFILIGLVGWQVFGSAVQ